MQSQMMIHELIRSLMFSFGEVEKDIPREGKILDVGCGSGMFTMKMARNFPEREVMGLDPSPGRIELARRRSGNLKNLKYKTGYLAGIRDREFDCVVIIDVLYLLPETEKLKLVKQVRKLLKKGGKLIIKFNGKSPGWKYGLLLAEEALMVKVLKLTYSDYGKVYFLSGWEYRQLLEKAGFKVVKEKRLSGKLGHLPHAMLVAEAI